MSVRIILKRDWVPGAAKSIGKRLAFGRTFTLLIGLTFALQAFSMPRLRQVSPAALDGSLSHLATEMDRYHSAEIPALCSGSLIP
jgi:hypothetical protein